jgi:hypothetical protein
MTTTRFVLDILQGALLFALLLIVAFVTCLCLIATVMRYQQNKRRAAAHRFTAQSTKIPLSRVTPLGYWSKQQSKRVSFRRMRERV